MPDQLDLNNAEWDALGAIQGRVFSAPTTKLPQEKALSSSSKPSAITDQLKSHLETIDNPEWWLQQLALTLETSPDLDINQATKITDELHKKEPNPPPTEEDKAWQLVDDYDALQVYSPSSPNPNLKTTVNASITNNKISNPKDFTKQNKPKPPSLKDLYQK